MPEATKKRTFMKMEQEKEVKPKRNRRSSNRILLYIGILSVVLFAIFYIGLIYFNNESIDVNKLIESQMYDNLNKADLLLSAIDVNQQIKLISFKSYNESEVKRLNRERQNLLYKENNDLGMDLPYEVRMDYVNAQIEHIKRVKNIEESYNISLRNQIEIMALEG
ncbi:MAG: hypothetical protein QME12_07350 [Nanoarchaeota archaeon]|nr:hypothetical protein [Nanoarchaeota archaeon]